MEELLQEPTDGVGDAIVVPLVFASQFELKIGLLNLVTAISFHGFENDDPHSYIRRSIKFLQMFKKLHINISLAEALALMLKYTKMLKDLFSNKEKLLELANTPLTENCSAVLFKKLPKKLKDPRKFLIPYDFPKLEKYMALADLGASIILMPLSVWKKLMLLELIPTRMTLELANRYVAYPVVVAEDICVQVDPSTDSSPKTDIDIIDPILERFTDKPGLVYLFSSGDDDDDLFDFKSDNKEWKKLFDSTLHGELSKIDALISFLFENKDKVFNPGILVRDRAQIVTKVTPDEELLILEDSNLIPLSSNHELLFHLELSVTETLLSFSSKNKDKVFNPEILISKGVHSFTLVLSHRIYETFKTVNVHLNILNKSLMKIFPFLCFCPKDKGIQGESS
nr:reverse transcriptase domain-containing protein [Tanacetum cinerariifolium]